MAEPNIETKIAVLTTVVETLNDSQEKKFDKLFKILEGNGSVGIVTQTELNKVAITRLWKVLGIGVPVTLAIIGILVRVLS